MAIPVDAAAAALREAMRETVKRYSLWYLIQGVLLVVAGVLAIISPVFASVAIVSLLGWVLIISGVLQAVGLIGATNVPHFWLQLISAVLAVLIGVLLLRSPESGLLVMTMLLIVYFMVEGIAKVIFALTIRPFPNWGWVLASGVVGIVLAFILWANMPLTASWVLGLMLGILLVSEGAALTYLAWQVHKAPAVKDA
ncbi:HdeD family acid-resistance protein [Methyloceanibacter sp. wino2]|uniref:HdeD family acid-resistance protein n=1 Tax=Methyloceanibacter sp. wino2 TaxID=2170729 RepID=UPI000D3E387F|nr:HdeD family acid-resistance protein [Methyloceanibacter sp. wino2]